MKYIFVSLFLILSLSACATVPAQPVDRLQVIPYFNNQITACDNAAELKLKAERSTLGMIAARTEQLNCYFDIAQNIIVSNYTKNQEQMLRDLETFRISVRNVAAAIYRHDDCYPLCGTIVGLETINAKLTIFRSYLDLLILRQKPLDL